LNEAHQESCLSWQVHSGLTGIANVEMNTFTAICGMAISFSADCYQDILLLMIDAFKIDIANTKIKDYLKAAKLAPFAQDLAETDQIYRQLVKG
jgi:hypothetical protein